LLLKRAQQEQYKHSLEMDKKTAGSGGSAFDGRISLRQQQQPPVFTSTGLFVGPDMGAATRQALHQQKQQDYARELARDRETPAIPTLRVPIQKPPSACSPRPGDDDNGYFNTGTSIQNFGVPTALAKQRAHERQVDYRRQLDADPPRGAPPNGGPRRASPPRRPLYPESANPSHNTLQLHNSNDVDTAAAIKLRQAEREKYLVMLEAAKNMPPAPQTRVSLVAGGNFFQPQEPATAATRVGGRIRRIASAEDYGRRAAEEGGW
jgi:hypothetical protein